MTSGRPSLDERYTAESGRILVSGIDALVRLPIEQIRRDRRAGLKTAGYVSGYRGSPLGGFDQRLAAARAILDEHDVHVQPGVNEDLAATAVFGSQQVNLHPGARTDGVFGIWYGKAPGVDRSGDVFRHANMAGTWRLGGVLAIAGDDPLAKSSSIPSQSEFAFADAEIPVLTPADIQDVLDLGLHGLALSRCSGLWVGMIALADVMDGSATIEVDPDRLIMRMPPEEGAPRHITLDRLQLQNRLQAEAHLRTERLPAALRYARRNPLNAVVADSLRPRFGIVASGKSWSATLAALDLLGLDLRDADRLGLRLMKVGMPWPLEPEGMRAFASGLETVLVVEAKRPLIEIQFKDQLYNLPADRRPSIVGKRDGSGASLLSDIGDLDAPAIASALIGLLPKGDERAALARRLAHIVDQQERARLLASSTARPPHFCSGCPHSRSTRVPDGSRAMAGIGCHIMTQWLGGEAAGRGPAEGYSQMGGEGAAWLGQMPFTETPHVFVNLGDGTYHHSGLLAIRAAVAASARITYKILYNDAVAMTGGQAVDGPISVERIAAQVRAEGVSRTVVVSERPERFRKGSLPADVGLFDRADLASVQKELRGVEGVSVLIFDQTCAAEKRRRRKRGIAPTPAKRVFINERVCEGCGDCSRQSHCLSIEPVETAFGTKRRIDQSSCNQDLSCVDGFCPSFVEVEGGDRPKRAAPIERILRAVATLPMPDAPGTAASANVVLAGIGGTGVTTLSAVLAKAAHLDGRAVRSMDMTGLAQKGGAVLSHLRFGPANHALGGAGMLPGAADLVIGCDPLVTAGPGCLELCSPERTTVVTDQAVSPTGRFALFQEAPPSADDLTARMRRMAGPVHAVEAGGLAEAWFGDRIFANMMLAGAAFQLSTLPLSLASIEAALDLNGVATEQNKAAFHAGRVLVASPGLLAPGDERRGTGIDEDLDGLIERLSKELIAYQNAGLAERFRSLVAGVRLADAGISHSENRLTRAVARNLFKLMAYKDEYEVARLHSDPAFHAKLKEEFGETARLSIRLAPPLLAPVDPAIGRPRKMSLGPWIFPLLRLLARLKGLRGTPFDPFGRTEERRRERQAIDEYRRLLARMLPSLADHNYETAVALASMPEEITGFGPVKAARFEAARVREEALLASFESLPESTCAGDETFWPIAAE